MPTPLWLSRHRREVRIACDTSGAACRLRGSRSCQEATRRHERAEVVGGMTGPRRNDMRCFGGVGQNGSQAGPRSPSPPRRARVQSADRHTHNRRSELVNPAVVAPLVNSALRAAHRRVGRPTGSLRTPDPANEDQCHFGPHPPPPANEPTGGRSLAEPAPGTQPGRRKRAAGCSGSGARAR